MKPALFFLSLLAFALPALAGDNPDVVIYLDADPPNQVHRVDPSPGDTFDVCVCLHCFGAGSGTRGTAFLLERTFSGFKLSQTNLLGGLEFGDAEVDGWTIVSGADCAMGGPSVVAARIEYLYTGTPGHLDLAPHPGTGREILDCDFWEDQYCIAGHLGVGTDPTPPECDSDCMDWRSAAVLCWSYEGSEAPPPRYRFLANPRDLSGIKAIHIEVFDPDTTNYSGWSGLGSWWTHRFQFIGNEIWISWFTETGVLDATDGFAFSNPNAPTWGRWSLGRSWDPHDSVIASWNYPYASDCSGGLVWAPGPSDPVESVSWGAIKALYR